MQRTKRMLFVTLTSFAIFAILAFLTFSGYAKNSSNTTSKSTKEYIIQSKKVIPIHSEKNNMTHFKSILQK